MNRARTEDVFGHHRRQSSDADRQSPLIEDAKQTRRAARKPTSRLEQRWPVYLGVGLPALGFGAVLIVLIAGSLNNSQLGLRPLLMGVPLLSMSFVIASLVLTYVFSSIRNGAETLGNISLLSASNTGFKIGAAVGFGLFLWFTPIVFGDPFAGNPSAPSAIIAQLALKALGFIGLAGAIGGRLEKFLLRTHA